jgi:hypothetical protein
VDLHEAALDGDLARVEELLDRGVPVDELDPWENTPLLLACFSEVHHPEVVALLRERGADPHRRNIHWDTPRTQAYERFLLSGFDPLGDLPAPKERSTEVGELRDEELACVVRAVRGVVARDPDVSRELGMAGVDDEDPYIWTTRYGRWGTVDILVPPGDPRSWTVGVIRYDAGVDVDVDMWTRQEGRSDLTLRLRLKPGPGGSIDASFHGLYVM